MALEHTPICDFGWKAPAFSLPSTDGKTYTFEDVKGENGTLIMFICNHCPYVVGILDRLQSEMAALQDMGIGVAAISANDANDYPADSFENMGLVAVREAFSFPYLYDETQTVAKAYDAICTPDFFGFDANGGLQYRGRLDDAGKNPKSSVNRRELFVAMKQVVATGRGPEIQTPSMGCSIKWK
ncbi:MAG: thioredoxin family protein [Paracoccaceae bacterium]|nr:thioredoxin family protein [Paracoccaceae bacterium]MDG2260406.1 thioredoxin family protein [Paracoccaceae bacterium]